jgi:curved DNA-binding protein CbpA
MADFNKYKYPIIADNYYEQLGLKSLSDITEDQVDDAYQERYRYWRKLRGSVEVMSDVNAALEELGKAKNTLKNLQKKRQYDQMLKKN